ncbi:hypothetical protein ACFFRR_005901 [Megaselia abdita]
MFIVLAVLIVTLVTIMLLWIKQTYNYFDGFGIIYDKPTPILGSMKDALLQRIHLKTVIENLYKKYKSHSVVGIFEGTRPVLMITHPEVINQVGVQHFNSFLNHKEMLDEKFGLIGKTLIALKDQKWRDMRSTLTPSFSGSKLKAMIPFIEKIAKHGVKHLKLCDRDGLGEDIEMKEFFARLTNDVIATTAFGLEIDSLKHKDNEFFALGKSVTNFNGIFVLKMLLTNASPKLAKLLNIKFVSSKNSKFINDTIIGSMKFRRDNNILREDMINLLMEARESSKATKHWTDDEIVAQCLIFIIGGLDSVSSLLCTICQMCIENPEEQRKLIEEIHQTKNDLKDESLTYEQIQGLSYMDMFISETLRLWPPTFITDRNCTKDCVLDDPITGKTIQVKAGENLLIPISALHKDPTYFPEPNKFDPQRFSPENKSNIKHCTYIPFGVGPRNCIAQRLALIETKCLLFHILDEFHFTSCEKSTIPISLDPSTITFTPRNGFWFKVIKN